MECYGIVESGCEQVFAEEIQGALGKSKTVSNQTLVAFQAKTLSNACKVCYSSRIAKKILLAFGTFTCPLDLEQAISNIGKSIEKSELYSWLAGSKNFRVSCSRIGMHSFTHSDIEKEAGGVIFEKLKAMGKGKPVELTDPELTVHIHIMEKRGWIGIDLAGKDLSKRAYRIFNYPRSLKGNIAFSALMLAGYEKKDTLIDPFCGSGTIPIEAAAWSHDIHITPTADELAFSRMSRLKGIAGKIKAKKTTRAKEEEARIFAMDYQLNNINSTRKNSKIAGVNEYIDISKKEIDWLETFFEKGSVDKIITQPPPWSKHAKKSELEKLYKELFVQAGFVLKKTGRMAIISTGKKDIMRIATRCLFEEKGIKELFTGRQRLFVIIFGKQQNI